MFSVAANYELPFGKGKAYDLSGPADVAFGGWRVNTIFQARTGLALTVYDSAGQSFQATRSFERPDRLCKGDTNASGPDDVWLDINCFAHAAPGTFGNSGVGILHGPGYWNADLGLSKDIHFGERYATFKIEAFNVFNHPNFALNQDRANIADPANFGRIGNTFSAPRIVELVIKFTY